MEVKFEIWFYLDVIYNKFFLKIYEENIKIFGYYGIFMILEFLVGGFMDMGNVFYVVLSIYLLYYIGSDVFNYIWEFNIVIGIMFVCVKEKFDISLLIVKFLLVIYVVFGLWKLIIFVSFYIIMYMWII